MLWIMDVFINISMEFFWVFVGDNLFLEQCIIGFVMQSFFIGIGVVIVFMLFWVLINWFGVSNIVVEGEIVDFVKWFFYLGVMVFLLAVLWMVFCFYEYLLEQLKQFDDIGEDEVFIEVFLLGELQQWGGMMNWVGGIVVGLGIILVIGLVQVDLNKELYVLVAMLVVVGLFWLVVGGMMYKGNYQNGFVIIMSDLLCMFIVMK